MKKFLDFPTLTEFLTSRMLQGQEKLGKTCKKDKGQERK